MRFVQLMVHEMSSAEVRRTRYDLSIGPEPSKIDQDPEMAFLGPSLDRVVVGITGPMGAGKAVVARYLEKQWGFRFHSLSQLVFRETRRRYAGRITSDMMTRVGNELREEHGPGHFAEQMLRIIEHDTTARYIVVDGLLNPAEVRVFQKMPWFYLIGLTASLKDRWASEEGEWASYSEFEAYDREFQGEQQPSYGLQISECLQLVMEMIDQTPQRGFLIENVPMLRSDRFHAEVDKVVDTIERQIGQRIM